MNITPPRIDDQEELSQLMAINDVARQLNISHKTLQRWDKAGKLKAIRFTPNGMRFYKKSDIEACIVPKIFNSVGVKTPEWKIVLREFGVHLDSENDGQGAWIKIQPYLEAIDEKGELEIDFIDIVSLGLDWTEAFLVPLHRKYGNRLSLTNVEDLTQMTILEIAGLYKRPGSILDHI